MADKYRLGRRGFLKQAVGAIGVAGQLGNWPTIEAASAAAVADSQAKEKSDITYPRTFSGKQLKMIAFPLGGVAAGSLSLGGRGQLRDWEIFNRPNKGFSPPYAFPSIWAQAGSSKPIARVLESRILPPYEGQDGLGSNNSPGLSRIASATFSGAYPLAHIKFDDPALAVLVELEAFSPFIPHDADDSGLPAAILRYRVTNHGHSTAKIGIAFSIDNPVMPGGKTGPTGAGKDSRQNEYKKSGPLQGIFMSNPSLPDGDPTQGSFVLAALPRSGSDFTYWVAGRRGAGGTRQCCSGTPSPATAACRRNRRSATG